MKKQILLLLLLGLLCSIGNVWAGTEVTWSITEANVTTLTGTQGAHIDVGSGTNLFQVYAVRGGGSNKNSDSWENNVGLKFGDGNLYKSGIAVYVPSTSNNIESIEFFLKTTNTRVVKYVALDAIGLVSEPSTTNKTLSTSFESYEIFTSPVKQKYYTVGGYSGGSGNVYLQKIVVTFAGSSGGGGDPADTYDITYHCNGATDECPSNATEQTALPNPLPIPSKTDYSFGGWYTDEDLTVPAVAGAPLSADADLYAKWIKGVMHFWFAKESDRTSAGVVNSDIFLGTPTGSGSASYSATIEGKVYTITGRSSNATSSITFTIPSGKMAVLYAVTVGSSSRSLILKKGTPAVNVKSIVLPNSANEQTITNLDAGGYTLTSSGNIGWCMLALKIYNPEPYELSLTENTWATFCPSFDVVIPDDARLTVYKATLAGELLTASPITGSIPAGTGVLLKANETADDYIFEKTEDAVTIDGNSLLGTTWPLTPDVESNTYYVLDAANSRFARFEGEIPANKAYVMISGAYSAAPAIRFEIEEENNATNIEKITTNGNTIKFIENGQFLIKRDGITYDALGRTIR